MKQTGRTLEAERRCEPCGHTKTLHISRLVLSPSQARQVAGLMAWCGAKNIKVGKMKQGAVLVSATSTASQLAEIATIEANRADTTPEPKRKAKR